MPNWIEGSFKMKGKYEDILRFFKEGINVYDDKWNASSKKNEYIAKPKKDWMYIDESVYQDIKFKTELRGCRIENMSNKWAYIEGTERAFIKDYIPCHITEYDKGFSVAVCNVCQAWGFREDNWVDLAKKYNVDIRLFGIECGMGFQEYIEIINGEITKNESPDFDCFEWDCIFPWMGG